MPVSSGQCSAIQMARKMPGFKAICPPQVRRLLYGRMPNNSPRLQLGCLWLFSACFVLAWLLVAAVAATAAVAAAAAVADNENNHDDLLMSGIRLPAIIVVKGIVYINIDTHTHI